MRSLHRWLRRQIAGALVILLAAPLAEAAAASPVQALRGPQQNVSSVQNQPKDSQSQAETQDTIASLPARNYPDNPEPRLPQVAGPSEQTGPIQSSSEPSQNGAANPVGTAAAPIGKTTGVAASRPAGAVIAPAKQRRARSILIRVGVILGAAVAIGTVVALSKASPSRPN
jgi:hypothetical protein